MKTSIEKKEWVFVAVITSVILVITSLPYVFAQVTAPDEKEFMGFIINTSDHAQYLSWYKAFQSDNLINNRQTSEANPKVFFNLLWWSLAQFGKIFGLNYRVVYQIFRWLAGAFFLFTTYGFSALFLNSKFQRRFAFLVIGFGAGLGWILVAIKIIFGQPDVIFPLDVYIAEGNAFLCILGYPHFAEAAGLILLVIGTLLVGEQRGQLRYAGIAGLLALFLGLQHTYDLLIVWIIPIVYGAVLFLIKRQWPTYWFRAMLIVGIISWPPALYSMLLTHLNPIWEQVLAQFVNAGVFTPNPLHMLILMGLPLWSALVTSSWWIYGYFKDKDKSIQNGRNLFLVVWLFTGWALTYIPTDFQVHMISSWQIPIGLISVIGICQYIFPLIEQRWPLLKPIYITTGLIVLLFAFTNIYLILWRFVDLNRYNYPYFLYKDEVSAMHWLEENTPPDSIILSSYATGRYIPGISGQIAFLSHWAQTVDFFQKRNLVDQFFSANATEEERNQILSNYSIDYIIYGPAEQQLGDFDPSTDNSIKLIFSLTPQVLIYKVELP